MPKAAVHDAAAAAGVEITQSAASDIAESSPPPTATKSKYRTPVYAYK